MARVLLVSPHYPPRLGGLERYAHRLATGLAGRHGHRVTVVTTGPGAAVSSEVADGLKVVSLPVRFRLSATPFNPAWFAQLRRIIAEERPDVVNTHAPVVGLADVCLAVRGRVPAVATYHAGSMRKGPGGPAGADAAIAAYEATVLPALLRRAEAVVTTHPGRTAGGVAGHYVPPGVDTSVFRPDGPGRRQPDLVLFAGRVEHASAWKGLATLLEAVALVAGRHPSVRLVVAGGGDAVDHHRRMAGRLGISDRVEFAGTLGPERLAAAYRSAAVAVLPSLTGAEAFGMVLIEAMACATPVVASRVGGMPAVVADTGGGVLAEPGDPRSLAGAIGDLLADPGRARRLAASGLERVRTNYRWEAVADAHHRLIEAVGARAPSLRRRDPIDDRRAG
ncbi:MAG TPA: glycosyltransferase family 4 protein [Acidimicrobiales bacterium]|nr:glycosyltransferase family 4 protein [Acidimicrobiales bacterium]